jgi:hypothetical protein
MRLRSVQIAKYGVKHLLSGQTSQSWRWQHRYAQRGRAGAVHPLTPNLPARTQKTEPSQNFLR